MFMNRIANPFMKWLLRSPFHFFISKGIMLLTYTGRKSGKVYSTPINYIRDGDTLVVMSNADRTWWRNLRGGATVTLHLRGKSVPATGEVHETGDELTQGLLFLLREVPAFRKYFKIELDDNNQPTDADAFAQLVDEKVIVRFAVHQ